MLCASRDLELLPLHEDALPTKNRIPAPGPHQIAGYQQATDHRDRDPFLTKIEVGDD
jgi:hypothetical protein